MTGTALAGRRVAVVGAGWAGLAAAVLGLTAVGSVEPETALSRSGAKVGDDLWVSGSIGDAGLGLAIALGHAPHDAALLKRFRRPEPRLALGRALIGTASAAMSWATKCSGSWSTRWSRPS